MISGVLRIVLILLEVVVLFNLIIIVHEVGHFLAARWRGLVVDRFGIWFGKPLWKKTINGVQYSLGSVPAGGFVSLPQMAPMEAIEGKVLTEKNKPLPPIKPLDKIIVAFAGPLFSFLLAILFAMIVWGVGRPVSESERSTTVGYLIQDGPAAKAGILPGDKILEVDGKAVTRFAGMTNSVIWNVVRSEGETIPFKVQRGNEILTLLPKPVIEKHKAWQRAGLRQVLLEPSMTPIVAQVEPGTPAAKAGLEAGDILESANARPLYHLLLLSDLIAAHPNEAIELGVRRGDRHFSVNITPTLLAGATPGDKPLPRIGIRWDLNGVRGIIHPGPVEQVVDSVQGIVNTISALFSSKSGIKAQHLSGPIGIMHVYFRMFSDPDGWRMALWFSVVLNVNLALLNLLPLPVLDGGHITLALLEMIRRKPINTRVLEVIQTICVVLILGYMAYVTFFDVQDLAPQRETTPPLQEEPQPESVP